MPVKYNITQMCRDTVKTVKYALDVLRQWYATVNSVFLSGYSKIFQSNAAPGNYAYCNQIQQVNSAMQLTGKFGSEMWLINFV